MHPTGPEPGLRLHPTGPEPGLRLHPRFARVGHALRETSHDGGLRRRLFKSFGQSPKDEPTALPPIPPGPEEIEPEPGCEL